MIYLQITTLAFAIIGIVYTLKNFFKKTDWNWSHLTTEYVGDHFLKPFKISGFKNNNEREKFIDWYFKLNPKNGYAIKSLKDKDYITFIYPELEDDHFNHNDESNNH